MALLHLFLFKSIAGLAKTVLPVPIYASMKNQQRRFWWGGLRRVTPFSRTFGMDRGLPVDRYYIENFLAEHAHEIRGRTLEVGDNRYTRRFGGDRVTQGDVLHVKAGNPMATIIADLADADHIPSNTFDCVICTQTLMFIYDVNAAVRTLHRILKPGGTVLATVAGISQICRADLEQWGDYWRFNTQSARRMFEEVFPPASVQVQAGGNVLSTVAFLHGLPTNELTTRELDHQDCDYELVVMIRAQKSIGAS